MTYDARGLSFGSVAEQYDLFRPSPPPEIIPILGDLRGREVVEVAAGTGKWTRLLVELGADVTVVEPDDDMRAVLSRRSPGVHTLKGAAEHLPLLDASFDVVMISSAWHWFEQPDASMEMARVMRDNAVIFVMWNGFSRDVPWIASLGALRERANDEARRPRGWAADFGIDGPFDDVRQVHLDWTWPRTIDEMVSLFGTYSGAIIRDGAGRLAMESAIRQRLESIAVDGVVEVPMTVRGTLARRRVRD